MRYLKNLLAVLGATMILVLAGNTIALATTGHSFLLGKANKATKTTGLTRTTSGPVLTLKSRSGTNPPMAVNGKGKVVNLNADTVDGLDSGALRTRSYVFTGTQLTNVSDVAYTLNLPNGSYLLSYSLFFGSAQAGGIECYADQDNKTGADVNTAYSSVVHTLSGTWDPALTGTGLVTKTPTSKITLYCDNQGANTFSTVGVDYPLQIVATPTTVVSSTMISPNP